MAHEYGHTATASTQRQADTSGFVIKDFIIDTSNVRLIGDTRLFKILGDVGAKFNLEITTVIANVVNYYNFTTKQLQTTPTKLIGIIGNSGYVGGITIPAYIAALKFDFLLLADITSNTRHDTYREVKNESGGIDVNASKGSNSLMLKKIIYQVADTTLTVTPVSPNALTNFGGMVVGGDTIVMQGDISSGKIPFSTTAMSANGKAFRINTTASNQHFFIGENSLIGAPVVINGEDPFDNGQAVRSADKVVNGDFSAGTATDITMDDDVAALWVVGDRITGNAILDAKTGVNAVTITAINVGSNAKVFTMSEAVAIDDDETLTFTEPYYYRWEVANSYSLSAGISVSGTNVVADSSLAPYLQTTTIMGGTEFEQTITDVNLPAVTQETTPVATMGGDKRTTLATQGNVIFNTPQPLILSGDTVLMSAYGASKIKSLKGWDIEITDLTTTLRKPVTTTTAAVINSTTVPVALGHGVMDGVSTVSSPNISIGDTNPTVNSTASYTSSTATLTLSSEQNLENGETLTFDGAGQQITIAGNIKVNKSNGNATLKLDVEKFITATLEFTS